MADYHYKAPARYTADFVPEVRVDHKVPVPIYRRTVKYPALYYMELGDSFLFLDEEYGSIKQAVQHCRRITKPKRRFVIRQVTHNAYRIWRIE